MTVQQPADSAAPATAQPQGTSPGGPSGSWRDTGLGAVFSGLLRLRELSVVVVTVGLFIYFAVSKGSDFTGLDNIGNIANLTSSTAIIAAGEVMLLVCGEIDLSVGQTFALTPFIMMAMNDYGIPLFPSLLIALLVAAAFGLFNGVVTVILGLPSFITTLGTLYLIHGITLKVSGSFPRAAPQDGFLPHLLGGWQWSQIIWAISIALVMQIVLTSTKWGAYTIATGGNFLGASEAGIRVRAIKIRAFVLTAVLGGFAGIMEGIHISQNFDPNAGGNDLMFAAVASSVIGGTALLGGSGTVIGAFFGAALLGILQDGFNVQGINSTTFIVVEGIAIIAAMVLNTQLSRFRTGARAG